MRDKREKGRAEYRERLFREAQTGAAKASLWLSSADAGGIEADEAAGERTWRFSQRSIADASEAGVARKRLDLQLGQLGPYRVRFTPNGRHAVLGGRRGHLATFDWQKAKLGCEVQVRETVRDVTFLHHEARAGEKGGGSALGVYPVRPFCSSALGRVSCSSIRLFSDPWIPLPV